MSRIFVSEGTGAAIYLFADDHCPPHVHARHRQKGWIARVQFSFLSNEVGLMSIAPVKVVPLQRVVNRLLDDVQERVKECRKQWWATRQTTCLANQWAVVLSAGKIEVLEERKTNAKQIKSASYEAAAGKTRVAFQDGTVTEVRVES